MIASTRRDWATAQQRLRVEEASKDCQSIFESEELPGLADVDVPGAERVAIGAAEDDIREFDRFIAAGGRDA